MTLSTRQNNVSELFSDSDDEQFDIDEQHKYSLIIDQGRTDASGFRKGNRTAEDMVKLYTLARDISRRPTGFHEDFKGQPVIPYFDFDPKTSESFKPSLKKTLETFKEALMKMYPSAAISWASRKGSKVSLRAYVRGAGYYMSPAHAGQDILSRFILIGFDEAKLKVLGWDTQVYSNNKTLGMVYNIKNVHDPRELVPRAKAEAWEKLTKLRTAAIAKYMVTNVQGETLIPVELSEKNKAHTYKLKSGLDINPDKDSSDWKEHVMGVCQELMPNAACSSVSEPDDKGSVLMVLLKNDDCPIHETHHNSNDNYIKYFKDTGAAYLYCHKDYKDKITLIKGAVASPKLVESSVRDMNRFADDSGSDDDEEMLPAEDAGEAEEAEDNAEEAEDAAAVDPLVAKIAKMINECVLSGITDKLVADIFVAANGDEIYTFDGQGNGVSWNDDSKLWEELEADEIKTRICESDSIVMKAYRRCIALCTGSGDLKALCDRKDIISKGSTVTLREIKKLQSDSKKDLAKSAKLEKKSSILLANIVKIKDILVSEASEAKALVAESDASFDADIKLISDIDIKVRSPKQAKSLETSVKKKAQASALLCGKQKKASEQKQKKISDLESKREMVEFEISELKTESAAAAMEQATLEEQHRLKIESTAEIGAAINTMKGSNDRVKALSEFLKWIQTSKRVKDMFLFAKSKIINTKFRDSVLNRQHDLFPLSGGRVIELKTGEIRERIKEDYFSHESPCDFITAADWTEADIKMNGDFVNEIFAVVADDADQTLTKEFVEYKRIKLGSYLSGRLNRDIDIMHGAGLNSKTTLLNAMRIILGKFCTFIDKSLVCADPKSHKIEKGSSHTAHLLPIEGKRLVIVNEISDVDQFREDMIKVISSGDTIAGVRGLYQNKPREITPFCKLALATNIRPTKAYTDEAVRDRIKLEPYSARFLNASQLAREHKEGKYDESKHRYFPGDVSIKRELENVEPTRRLNLLFSWMAGGCIKFYDVQSSGIHVPLAVEQYTQASFLENDRINEWLNDACTVISVENWADMDEEEKISSETSSKDLWETFSSWATRNECHLGYTKRIFYSSLDTLSKRVKKNTGYYFPRICINHGRD